MKAMKYNAASEPALRIELSIDERHALKSAAERLRSEFAGAFDAQTVERLVESSYKDVAAIRPIRDEIERRVRQLLDDLRIPDRS